MKPRDECIASISNIGSTTPLCWMSQTMTARMRRKLHHKSNLCLRSSMTSFPLTLDRSLHRSDPISLAISIQWSGNAFQAHESAHLRKAQQRKFLVERLIKPSQYLWIAIKKPVCNSFALVSSFMLVSRCSFLMVTLINPFGSLRFTARSIYLAYLCEYSLPFGLAFCKAFLFFFIFSIAVGVLVSIASHLHDITAHRIALIGLGRFNWISSPPSCLSRDLFLSAATVPLSIG